MKSDEAPPPKVDWLDAILTIIVGATLTYFFFEPIKNAVVNALP